jgi:hypothetical protein
MVRGWTLLTLLTLDCSTSNSARALSWAAVATAVQPGSRSWQRPPLRSIAVCEDRSIAHKRGPG